MEIEFLEHELQYHKVFWFWLDFRKFPTGNLKQRKLITR